MHAIPVNDRETTSRSRQRPPVAGLLAAICLLAVGGCGAKSPDAPAESDTGAAPAAILARVDGTAITTADLERAILNTPRPEQFEYINPPQRQELLETLIDRKLLAQQARRDGLDREPAIAERLADADDFDAEQLLAQALLDRRLDTGRVTAEAVAADYQNRAAEFMESERVLVTRVVTADEQSAARARQRLLEGADEAALEQRMAGHGRVSSLWIHRRAQPGPMESAAFALEPGQVSEPFPAGDGWAVLRADERRAARQRPLAEVSAGIEARLEQQRRARVQDELIATLRKNAAVTHDPEALAAYEWQY